MIWLEKKISDYGKKKQVWEIKKKLARKETARRETDCIQNAGEGKKKQQQTNGQKMHVLSHLKKKKQPNVWNTSL